MMNQNPAKRKSIAIVRSIRSSLKLKLHNQNEKGLQGGGGAVAGRRGCREEGLQGRGVAGRRG